MAGARSHSMRAAPLRPPGPEPPAAARRRSGTNRVLRPVPLALIAVYSFGREDIVTLKLALPWTTENYRALSDPIYSGAVLRSVELVLRATLGCALVGFPIASSSRARRLAASGCCWRR